MNNKIKKLLCGSLVALSLPVFAACGSKPVLNSPTNLSIDQTSFLISWQEVENAEYYVVEINGKTYQTTTNSFPAADIISTGGQFYVRVLAVDRDEEFLPSEYSNTASIQNLLAFNKPVLVAENNVLSWTDVGAEFYVVSINGVKFEVTGTSVNLAELNSNMLSAVNFGKSNSFSVYAKATSNNKKSDVSNIVQAYVAAAQSAPTNLIVNKQPHGVFLTFEGVSTATSYTVKVGQTEFVADQNYVDISQYLTNGFGNYDISVKANQVEQVIGGETTLLYMPSAYSDAITYTHMPNFVTDRVAGLVIENGVLTFDAVEDATSYVIFVDNSQYTSSTNSYNLASLNLPAGRHNVSVKAKNGEFESLSSSVAEYKVTAVLNTPGVSVVEQQDGVWLYISPVANATAYQVQVNQTVYMATQLQQDITEYLVGGNNTITVVAVGDDDIYFNSAQSTANFVLLGAPENLQVQNGVLTFSAVPDSTGYEIYVNNNLCLVSNSNTVDISTYVAQTGVYQIKVRAITDSATGKFANLRHVTTERLAAPENVVVSQQNDVYTLTFNHNGNNVSRFDIYVNGSIACQTTQTSFDISMYLSLGQNTVYVVAVGDGQVYLNSNSSNVFEVNKTKTLNAVGNLQVYAEAGSYFVSFIGVQDAQSYLLQVYLSDSSVFSKTILAAELNQMAAQVDISSAIAADGSYIVQVTAQSSVAGVTNSTTQQVFELKAYNQNSYAANKFFYNGKEYSYCINDEQELNKFVYYAVLYRLDSAEVYINFDYTNKQNAYTSAASLIDGYLPSLAKFGVDVNQGDVLGQLFNLQNLSRIQEILTFIEELHDQIYLYYEVASNLTSQKSDCVYTLNFNYVGDYEATHINTKPTSSQANLPVSYTISPQNRTFAIDSLAEAPVETVAQLLMVVQNGRKPSFVNTSKTEAQLVGGKTIAERTYLKAKEVLSQICTDSMTDYQKALAIYDWIITNNQYDGTTYSSASGAPFSSSNLSEMSFYASGLLLNNLAVCKGIAQTFSLLCSIEGIKTIETFGLTGGGIDWANVDFTVSQTDLTYAAMGMSPNPKAVATYNLLANINSVGAHSWNRVYLDAGNGKQWYIVDATWDEAVMDSKEYLMHQNFLITDAELSSSRKELYPNGTFYTQTDSNGQAIDFSATDTYNYYKDSINKNCTYITTQTELNTVVQQMVTAGTTGFEVKLDSSVMDNYAAMLQTAFNSSGLNLSAYTYKRYGNLVFVHKTN